MDINSDDFDISTISTPTSSSSPISENMLRSLLNYGDIHHRMLSPKQFTNHINRNITVISSCADKAALKGYKRSLPIIATKRYAKATKVGIENISKSIINLHSHFKTSTHKDLFPPGTIYFGNDSQKMETEVQFKVRVPVSDAQNNYKSEAINSFGQLKVTYTKILS